MRLIFVCDGGLVFFVMSYCFNFVVSVVFRVCFRLCFFEDYLPYSFCQSLHPRSSQKSETYSCYWDKMVSYVLNQAYPCVSNPNPPISSNRHNHNRFQNLKQQLKTGYLPCSLLVLSFRYFGTVASAMIYI